jgi:hypothetical protein
MAPWGEPFPKACHISKKTFLEMEREKDVDESVKKMMNLFKGSSQEYTKEKSLVDEDMLEEQIYEEIY